MMHEENLLIELKKRIADPKRRIEHRPKGAPDLPPAATASALQQAQQQLGFGLPQLLQRVYLELANGGFGPGDGLLGVSGGYRNVDGRSIVELYAELRGQGWPEDVLILCDLGCAAWSCLDAKSPDFRILTAYGDGVVTTDFTLASWLDAWVSDVDMSAATFEWVQHEIMDPFTGQPTQVTQPGRAKGVKLIDW
jgi:hypothetical protein